MDNLINNIESIPLSGKDLQDMAMKMGNLKTKWILYEDLARFTTIEQLMGNLNTVFVLLQIIGHSVKPQIGHWISLSIDDKGIVNYYDPYGLTIEQDLIITNNRDLFSKLLKSSTVNINRNRHQSIRENQNECGRHTVVRSIFHFMNNDQYHSLVVMPLIVSRQISNADVLVSLMTAFLDMSDDVVKMFFRSKINSLEKTPGPSRGGSLMR